MEGRLDSVEDRTLIGEAEVRAVFGTGNKKVAGCMVNDGRLRKGCMGVVSTALTISSCMMLESKPASNGGSIYLLRFGLPRACLLHVSCMLSGISSIPPLQMQTMKLSARG